MHLLIALLATPALDVCTLPELGVTLETHQDDGTCVASVSYLAPAREASYSAVVLPPGSWSLLGGASLPAAEFIYPAGYLEDGVYIAGEGALQFELSGVGVGEIGVEPITCTCHVH
jgi:hypothetical protein